MKVESKFITIQSDINGVVLADYLDNAQVWTNNTVNVADTLSDVPVENLPELPQSGWVEKGLYKYNNSTMYCIQPHNRTIYTPDQTPALFSTYRVNSDALEWIANEAVKAGWKRLYNGKQYEVIQPHMTLEGWEPDKTPALWNEVVIPVPDVKPPQWNTSNWIQYVVGYQVYDSGKVWEAINLTHTWIQPALTGNGAISWKFVKDWVD